MKNLIYLSFILLLGFVVANNINLSDNQEGNIAIEFTNIEVEPIDLNTFYCLRQEKDID